MTPERAARVDFSYPAHRSAVAVALRKETGPLPALTSYGAAVAELTPLIMLAMMMLVFIGIANARRMLVYLKTWASERTGDVRVARA
jgi:hypothetical protein